MKMSWLLIGQRNTTTRQTSQADIMVSCQVSAAPLGIMVNYPHTPLLANLTV